MKIVFFSPTAELVARFGDAEAHGPSPGAVFAPLSRPQIYADRIDVTEFRPRERAPARFRFKRADESVN